MAGGTGCYLVDGVDGHWVVGMAGVAVFCRFGGDDNLHILPNVRSVTGGAVIGMNGLD